SFALFYDLIIQLTLFSDDSNYFSQNAAPNMPLTKSRLAHIVFESDDYSSKTFDIILLLLILGSVAVAMLDSVARFNLRYGTIFYYLEWAFTVLFTIEYALRIWLSNRAKGYIFSFYGVIDLLAILPTYLSLVIV